MINERFNDRSKVVGYVLSCPLRQRSDDCPAHALRKAYGRDWLAAVNSMSEQEASQLVECHRQCVKERTDEMPNRDPAGR